MLRAACRCTVAKSERAVWIDTAGTVVGAFWDEGPFLIQPKSRKDALKGAEELLQCGGFALVVLDGTEPEGTETVRLTRAVREGGGAFVAITPHPVAGQAAPGVEDPAAQLPVASRAVR